MEEEEGRSPSRTRPVGPVRTGVLRQPQLSPDTLDAVEEQHPLRIVQELVVEAVGRFAEDGSAGLVADCVTQ
jgi:hypothetical protein